VPVTTQTNSRSPSASLKASAKAGQALEFARDDNGGKVQNLQGQHPHPNFAKNAKLGWGTLGFIFELDALAGLT